MIKGGGDRGEGKDGGRGVGRCGGRLQSVGSKSGLPV